ncbi:MAG: polyprenyl synthetase family protein [Actinomycetaceae bacterium]|nr:polyprenyl synthetase family protein [Actinomycetaceae bacterium]
MEKPSGSIDVFNPSSFADDIHQRTLEFFDRQTERLDSHHLLPTFLQLARSYLGEGKAYRALAVSVGNYVAGGAPVGFEKTALALGVAMELYQASALVHDDLIDNSPTRRGHPSAHVAAGALHGDDAGAPVAILVGDFLLSLNHRATSQAVAECERQIAIKLHDYMAHITAEVAWGQYLDVLTERETLTNPAQLQRHITDVIALKSGHYSVMRPLVLGALIQSPPAQLITALQEAGQAWGIAFQMRDDAIGVFGDEEITGKPATADIIAGKRTVLLTLALQTANDSQSAAIRRTVGNPAATDQEIEQVREIIRETGAYDRHETLIAELVQRGNSIVGSLELDDQRKRVLLQLGQLLTHRNF